MVLNKFYQDSTYNKIENDRNIFGIFPWYRIDLLKNIKRIYVPKRKTTKSIEMLSTFL